MEELVSKLVPTGYVGNVWRINDGIRRETGEKIGEISS
jgi:hypothetical protein